MPVQQEPVTIEERSGVIVGYLSGLINAGSVPLVQTRLEERLVPGWPLVLELSAVNFLSSAGLNMFVALQRQLAATEAKLVLVALSDPVRNTLSWAGAGEFIPIYPDLATGLASLGPVQ